MELTRDKIISIQKNRGQLLMVDHVSDLEIGKYARGYKELESDLWFFKIHWPGDPNMPASLQLECLTQLSALPVLAMPEHNRKLMYVVSASNLKFKKKVTPLYKRFNMETKIISFKRGILIAKGFGFLDDELACSAELTLILADEVNKYKVNK
jgi:3-hydroxyacyl-[acyl-carrier-protein] dehydratase